MHTPLPSDRSWLLMAALFLSLAPISPVKRIRPPTRPGRNRLAGRRPNGGRALQREAARPAEREPRAERRVLVVDDDDDMVETVADVLELHGWTVLRAHGGADAVASADRERVDVVLMDIRMPKVDGVEALRAMKTRRPELPVILMTAFSADQVLHEALEFGVFRIVKKPIDWPTLLDLLERARPR